MEVHADNDHLLYQFLQTVASERTNEYGGSLDNRMRSLLEVINAVVETVWCGKDDRLH